MPAAGNELGSPTQQSDLLPMRQLLMKFTVNSMILTNFCNRDLEKFYDRFFFCY